MNEKPTPAQPGTPQGTQPHGTQPHGTQDNKSKVQPVNQPGAQPVNPDMPQDAPKA